MLVPIISGVSLHRMSLTGYNKFSVSLLIAFLMIACNTVQKNVAVFNWEAATELPPEQGQLRSIGYAGPIAGTHNGVLFIGGGANFPDKMPWRGGVKKYHDELFVYRPSGNNFQHFKLPYALAYCANVSTPKGLVSIGGENELGPTSGVLFINWDGRKVVVKQFPHLPIAITNASATGVDNIIYVAGGETNEAVSSKFYKLNMNDAAPAWQELAPLPQPTSHAVLVAKEGGNVKQFFLIGGRRKNTNGISDLYESVYAYNIANNEWEKKKPLPYALCAGTGTVWGEDYIVLFGGDKGETFHKVETLIAKINSEKDSVVKEKLNEEKIMIQSTHPGFSNELLWYNIKKDEWMANGAIPFAVPVTTTAVKMDGKIYIPSGEIKAGVRTPVILKANASD